MDIKLNVKPFQETLNAGMCGPASLKIILDYYDVKREEGELASLCKTDKITGTTDVAIKKTAESLGFEVVIKDNSDFNDVAYYLNQRIPLIVNWFTCGVGDCQLNIPDGHYSVIYGIDDTCIYLQDPELGGPRKILQEDFKTVWFDFRGLVINPDELIINQIIAIHKKSS